MRSSFLASVEVKVLHATEAHSSLDLTEVKHYITILWIDNKMAIARTKLNNFKSCGKYSPRDDENEVSNLTLHVVRCEPVI
jgi:hypothetical protein